MLKEAILGDNRRVIKEALKDTVTHDSNCCLDYIVIPEGYNMLLLYTSPGFLRGSVKSLVGADLSVLSDSRFITDMIIS